LFCITKYLSALKIAREANKCNQEEEEELRSVYETTSNIICYDSQISLVLFTHGDQWIHRMLFQW